MNLIILASNSPIWVIGIFTAIFVGIFLIVKSFFSSTKSNENNDDFFEKNPHNLTRDELESLKNKKDLKKYYLAYLQSTIGYVKVNGYSKESQTDFTKISHAYLSKFEYDDLLDNKVQQFKKLIPDF